MFREILHTILDTPFDAEQGVQDGKTMIFVSSIWGFP